MLVHVLVEMSPEARRERVLGLLPRQGVVLSGSAASGEFLERLTGGDFDLLIVDRERLPGDPASLIRSVRSLPEHPEVVVLTEREDAAERASLLAVGCLGVLNRELDDPALGSALRALVARRRDDAINRLRADRPEEQYSLNDFVSESPSMQIFLDLARRVVRADTSLLILGETGVGKERLARALHAEGPWSKGPFMAVNCGALPESLLESELFGHEEGAFTGATRSRKGYFELAHGGILFLDEIGEMPLHLQVKLLRVLDEHRIQRVGSEKSIAVDVRVMASTNRDLEADVEAKRFRADLFFRLAVVTLEIPPLRERREDVPQLVHSYLEHFRNQTGRPALAVDEAAMEALVRHDWPGNVRELVNTVERAVLLAGGERIGLDDLPSRIAGHRGEAAVSGSPPGGRGLGRLPRGLLRKPLSQARKEIVTFFESSYLAALLESTGGRIGEAARQARINERSLYDLMKRHGLRKENFKPVPRRAGRPRKL